MTELAVEQIHPAQQWRDTCTQGLNEGIAFSWAQGGTVHGRVANRGEGVHLMPSGDGHKGAGKYAGQHFPNQIITSN
jgi:hypothetical protein